MDHYIKLLKENAENFRKIREINELFNGRLLLAYKRVELCSYIAGPIDQFHVGAPLCKCAALGHYYDYYYYYYSSESNR